MSIGNLNTGHLKAHADDDINKALFPHSASSIGYDGGTVKDALDNISTKPFVATPLIDPALNSITQSMIDDNSGVVIILTTTGNDQTLPAPTDTTAGLTKFTVINDDASTNSINIIGNSTIVLDPGKKVQAIWEGTAYVFSEAEGIWLDDGTDAKLQNSTRNINVQSGKFKAGSNSTIKENGSGDIEIENSSATGNILFKINNILAGYINSAREWILGETSTNGLYELFNSLNQSVIRFSSVLSSYITESKLGIGTKTPNSTLDVQGSITTKNTVVNTATYTVQEDDYRLLIDYTSTGACTITFPSAQIVDGRELIIKDTGYNAGTNNITFQGESGELIDGLASDILNADKIAKKYVCDGTNLQISL